MKANLITIPKAYYHYGYVLIKLKFFNFFCMSIIWKKCIIWHYVINLFVPKDT